MYDSLWQTDRKAKEERERNDRERRDRGAAEQRAHLEEQMSVRAEQRFREAQLRAALQEIDALDEVSSQTHRFMLQSADHD